MSTQSIGFLSPQPIAAPTISATTYASKVNSKFHNKASLFVSIKDRIDQTINALPFTKQVSIRSVLKNACDAFQKRFPTRTKFADLDLVEALTRPMMDILIDTTMQRMLMLNWVAYIVANFRDVQAQPIQIYKIANKNIAEELNYYPIGNDLYASWDAQHTLAALYIIAVWIFKEDPSKVMVPVNIYKVSTKAEIRRTFVTGNTGAGKKLLDDIDIFQQQVYGVRVDGNNDTEWGEAELKQQYIEQADLFVTADKFGDTNMPGAIGRMQEIKHYSSDIIRKFCLYAATVQPPSGRPVASQEIEIMCAWFDMARTAGIDYTDDEIVDLSLHLLSLPFSADFHESSIFWDRARGAYTNWWNIHYSSVPPEHVPSRMSFAKNWRNGGTFLYYQLLKTWKGRVPRLNINTQFRPAAKDLF